MAGNNQPDDAGIGTLFSRLADDAKRYGRAEFTYFRTLAKARVTEARTAIAALALAASLALATVVALLVGFIMTLAELIGPGPATIVVVLLAGTGAALLARYGLAQLKAASKARSSGREP